MNKIFQLITLMMVFFLINFFPVLGTAAVNKFEENKSENNKNANPNLPSEFKYQGKPIDAFCIESFFSSDVKKVNLSQCSKEQRKYKIKPAATDLKEKGFFGHEYTHKNKEEAEWGGYVYYKYLGKQDDNHIIYFLQNTGGSGMFSYILLIKRDDDFITLKENLVNGDRCNGGIEQPRFENDQLFYTQNITPFDYLELAKEKGNLTPYDDLASCAACCQGSAEFVYDFKTTRLVFVNLGELPEENNPTQGKYQGCFDKIITQKIKSGKQKLTEAELKQLVRQFMQQCVK